MRVLICGSQSWTDGGAIDHDLAMLRPETDIVIAGGARGADTLARQAANEQGIHVAEVKALWPYYGKAAGHLRNVAMVVMLAPDAVWAYSHGTPGTQGTIDAARAAGIPVTVVGREAVAA